MTVVLPSRRNPAESVTDIIENAERVERYLAGMDRATLGEACGRSSC